MQVDYIQNQKKDKKSDTLNQLASGDTVLCPVRAWAAIVKRLRGYRGTSNDTPVSAMWENGCVEHITSKMLVNALEATVERGGSGTRCNQYTSWGTRNSLDLVWSSDGDVFRQPVGVHYHDVGKVVQQRLPTIHQKAGGTIQP